MPSVPISVNSSGANHIVASPGAGKFIRVHGYILMAAGSVNVTWQDTAATIYTGAFPLAAQCGVVAPLAVHDGWFDLADNVGLDLNLDASQGVFGHVNYSIMG